MEWGEKSHNTVSGLIFFEEDLCKAYRKADSKRQSHRKGSAEIGAKQLKGGQEYWCSRTKFFNMGRGYVNYSRCLEERD